MNPEKIRYIQNKVEDVAKRHDVKILLAVESGSRAWGFPSADSDYDVRFIYSRTREDYLAIEQRRDVIETELADDAFLGVPLDLNGWDLRKALRLALKSNAVVVEWLVSPVIYASDDVATTKILKFATRVADLHAFEYHYDHLARRSWTDIAEGGQEVKLKKYFYALRPALALAWIRRFRETPPMNIGQIMEKTELPDDLLRSIRQLVDDKARAVESDMTTRIPVIDDFLKQSLPGAPLEKSARTPPAPERLKEANELFLELVR